MKNVSWYERFLLSWFDTKKEEIVILVDSKSVMADFDRVFVHEFRHWQIWKKLHKHRIRYFLFGLFLEEPYIWFTLPNSKL